MRAPRKIGARNSTLFYTDATDFLSSAGRSAHSFPQQISGPPQEDQRFPLQVFFEVPATMFFLYAQRTALA